MIGQAFVIVWPPGEMGGCTDRGPRPVRTAAPRAGLRPYRRRGRSGPRRARRTARGGGRDPARRTSTATGIDDSKLLTATQREAAYERIVAGAVYAVANASRGVIDSRGLHRSNISLLRRRVRALTGARLRPRPTASRSRGCRARALAIKKGDAVAVSVAAASIVAKVTRDRYHAPVCIAAIRDFGFDHEHGVRHARAPEAARPPRAHADPPALLRRAGRPACSPSGRPARSRRPPRWRRASMDMKA